MRVRPVAVQCKYVIKGEQSAVLRPDPPAAALRGGCLQCCRLRRLIGSLVQLSLTSRCPINSINLAHVTQRRAAVGRRSVDVNK